MEPEGVLRSLPRFKRSPEHAPAPGGPPGSDAGVATVFVALAAGLLLLITGTALHVGAAVLARHRAEVAADLAALAGAADVLTQTERVCPVAARIAGANGATLTSCSQVGLDVLVQVRVAVPLGALSGEASGRARAGPVDGSTAPG